MKSIIVDVNEEELNELGISEEHISFDDLKKQILIQTIRKQRESLEKINTKYGFDLLDEEEIFNEVNEASVSYKNQVNKKND